MTRNGGDTIEVLVVEDDPALRELLEEEMLDAGYRVSSTADGESASRLLEGRQVDLVVSDLRLPGRDGLDLLQHARRLRPSPGFIVITAFGTVEQAVEALKQGADDFLTKPLKLEHLRISVARTLQQHRLQAEVQRYREALADDGFHGMIGNSAVMRRLFDTIRVVARADGTVLISGESGTGKELVARAIHLESPRSSENFVALNCAGIPPELLESELYGHAAGAFTGAQRQRTGLFCEADRGTLLLDEISEMPMEMQAKLLRVLQDGRVRQIGSNQEQQLDVRVIAATNRRLDEEIRLGRFREDLYYRLETFSIEVPPLRERGDDLELLISRFINRYNLRMEGKVRGISTEAFNRIRHHAFPGNVRELSNAVERAVAFCTGSEIRPADLPERLRRPDPLPAPAPGNGGIAGLLLDAGDRLPTLAELERRYIRLVLDRMDGNKRKAAQALNIGRRTLYRHLEERDR